MDFRDVAGGLPEKALGIGIEECCFNVIRDERYKYVHFAALPPLFFDNEITKPDGHSAHSKTHIPFHLGLGAALRHGLFLSDA